MKIRFLLSTLIALVFMIQPASTLAQMPPVGAKVFLNQNEVYLGEVFRVHTTGFSADPSYIRFISDTSPAIEAKFTIVGVSYSDIPLSVRIDEVINSSQDHNQFFIELKDFQGNIYQSEVKLMVIGQGIAGKIPPGIKFGVRTDCAVSENASRSIQATWRLFKEGESSKTLTTDTISRQQGYSYYGYYSFDIKAGDTFVIEVEPIKGMAAKPTTSNYRFTIPNPAPDVFYVPGDLVIFEYPSCLGGPLSTPSPTPISTSLPTPSPTPPPTTNIKVNATVLCGVNEKLTRSVVYMKREDGGAVVTSAEINGKGTFEYSGPSAVPGQGFILQAAEFPDEPPIIQSGPYPIVVPDPALPEITVSALFSSPYCLVGGFPPFSSPEPNITGDTTFYYYASPIPSPTPEPQSIGTTEPQGGLPQPTESPASQQTELTQVMISNYADFRFYNDPDDQGNSTISISNPNDPQNLEWTAKTMGPEKRMYVREIYSNGTYRDFEYTITHNDQRSSVSNIQILIKIVKKVARITIGDLDLEIDVKNPQVPLDFHLPGTEGQSQQFKIPVVITYSDGSTLHTALTFNYNPPPPPPSAPTPCPYQEDPQNCPYGGIRDCTGTVQEGICKYDGNIDPNCRETCNPAPDNTCAYTESFNCTGQNGGCGGGSGEMRKTIINTDCSESSISYCDGACAPSGGGGSGASCSDPYPECQEANTIWITPECDSDGNIINYGREDLGDLGQCQ